MALRKTIEMEPVRAEVRDADRVMPVEKADSRSAPPSSRPLSMRKRST